MQSQFEENHIDDKFWSQWTTWTDLRMFSGAVQLHSSSSGLIDDITQCSVEPVSWLFFSQLASKIRWKASLEAKSVPGGAGTLPNGMIFPMSAMYHIPAAAWHSKSETKHWVDSEGSITEHQLYEATKTQSKRSAWDCMTKQLYSNE